MSNHQKPIEQCGLWDILDWDYLAQVAKDATSNPRDNPLAAVAQQLINLGAKVGNEDIDFFHKLGKRYITSGKDAERRRQAGELALLLGADSERLIDYVAFKWGWFKR